jgi:hypothetical protein
MVSTPKQGRMDFRREGVVVYYPSHVNVVRLRKSVAKMKPLPDGFRPIRPVINLKVVNTALPHKKVNVFDPPLEVRVRYTDDDLLKARELNAELSLGFWNGKQWIRCVPTKLSTSRSKKWAGWGVVTIAKWGDPTIAWGK